MTTTIFYAATLSLLSIGLLACGGGGSDGGAVITSGATVDTGTLNFSITDAPVDL